MTDEQFEGLIARLESEARRAPERYQFRVLLLGMMGTAYLGAMLALIGVVLGVLVYYIAALKVAGAKLIIILAVFLWMVMKALWVKVPAPSGRTVHAHEAPELFAVIENLRARLNAPNFHEVLITEEFNAGVVQSPRLGIFGWTTNYLMIGLPLMKALSPEQFSAVLAHEFGHLAKGHGRWANWIYRQRLRWIRLMQTLETHDSAGSFLFMPFLRWFVPYFNAYSFPLARLNEYQAHTVAAQLTSPRAVAEALTSVDVVGRFLAERYWPRIHKHADEQPSPAFAPYVEMNKGVTADLDAESAQKWMEQAMSTQTGSVNTHPALPDRLKAIGQAPQLSLPAMGHAADNLLGRRLEAITESFDSNWKTAIQPSWEERHRQVQKSRQRLAGLDEKHAAGTALSEDEALERAKLTESTGNQPDEALAQFRALQERAPLNAAACLHLGARLLGREDSSGCTLVERAIELEPEALLTGAELLRDYYWRKDMKDEARAWHERLVAHSLQIETDTKERKQVLLADQFDAHGLDGKQLGELRHSLHAIHVLRKVYFLRKRLVRATQVPLYVLGYSVTGFFQLHSKTRAAEALRQIQELVTFPGETLIICLDGDNAAFGRKFWWKRRARVR